jgi:two-component system sensor histidine kinase PilS (NtrC family)
LPTEASTVVERVAGEAHERRVPLERGLASAWEGRSEAFWRSLLYFNVYRVVVASVLLGSVWWLGADIPFGSYNREVFLLTNGAYIAINLMAFGVILSRQVAFNVQLAAYIAVDVVAVVTMMYASGGIPSGLGLLLLPSLAAAGLMSHGRLTLFFAAVAALGVLGEQSYEVVFRNGSTALFVQAGLLATGFFATAWLAQTLAKRAVAIEAIAAQREVDLANMAQVNRLIIQDMQDGVLVVDERSVIRQINSRAEEILGPLSLAGREVRLHDYAPTLAARLEQWRRDPDLRFDPLRTVVGKQSTAARFVAVGRARNVGVVVFLEDLSRIQQQAQQLKLASLGRLTANIAHEIRNPLSAINHATELLMEDTSRTTAQVRMLQIIHDNAKRLDRMVQDVLKLNRRDQALRETFDLIEYLEIFVNQFCDIEKAEPAIIKLDPEVEPMVTFDRSHLNQVMWNLCRNAMRYCRKNPGSLTIRVRTGPRAGTIELSVIDDGPGVAEALRGHLFEPFFTTASSGTGLGLYIAREICEANGATLEYVERHQGAQFSVICKGAAT